MGSGFLLAIVLGLWGLVLYPTLSKGRINTSETKSIERFNKAMNLISDLAPTKNKLEMELQRKAALRRRNVTYFLFVINVGVIVASLLGYVPQYFSFIPVGALLMWLSIAFVAAQRQQNLTQTNTNQVVIRKNYAIYKNPELSKTLIKPDPERDLIMDERPFEKIAAPIVVPPQIVEEERRAQGA